MKHGLFISILATLEGCGAILGLLSRPQDPKIRPYQIEEVRITGAETQVELAGELTLPKGEGPFKAVILITGSGPQDRNETVVGHRPFLVLSDYLSRSGFAVLRFDDRGVGASSGDFASATLTDFAKDAAAAFHWLRADPRIDSAQIGFLGHSEGGYIAPLAAQNVSPRFMVFLAGPALPLLPDVMARQLGDILRAR